MIELYTNYIAISIAAFTWGLIVGIFIKEIKLKRYGAIVLTLNDQDKKKIIEILKK